MSWEDLRKIYLTILIDNGFRPEIDSDGDIHFKYEGGNYFVTANCDDTYFYLLYPGFWSVESPDKQAAALRAANATNLRMKTAKVILGRDMKVVSVTLECYVRQPSDVSSFLMRGLRSIQQAVDVFREEMRDSLN